MTPKEKLFSCLRAQKKWGKLEAGRK